MTRELAVNWTELTGGDRAGLSFSVGDTLDSRIPIYVVLAVSILIARWFACSRSGRLAHAAREDNLAARAVGVNPQVQQMIALLLSVAVVSVAASLRVYEIGNITPKFFFFEYTLITLVMLIVGGRNSVTGALTGVVVITVAREVARRMAGDGYEFFGISLDGTVTDIVFREGLPDIVLGLAMLVFMIVRPNGLLNDWELDTWIGRRLRRNREVEPAPATPDHSELAPSTLDVQELVVEFGAFRAVNGTSIEAVERPGRRSDRTERRRQDDRRQRHHRDRAGAVGAVLASTVGRWSDRRPTRSPAPGWCARSRTCACSAPCRCATTSRWRR